MSRLDKIRENERRSHMDTYTAHELYQDGSWLQRPVKTVMDLANFLEGNRDIRILDLGCGVGRNCIALADRFSEAGCRIDCVDILDFAIEKLMENAEKYGLSHCINGIVSPLDEFPVPANSYDMILAVSVLEHMDCRESFLRKLAEIREGLRPGGIVCLIINSNVTEIDKHTGLDIPAQFEVNLLTSALQNLLQDIFSGWEILKSGVREQRYDIPRGDSVSDLQTNVVTFAARKTTCAL